MKMGTLNASAHVSSIRRFSPTATGFSSELLSNFNQRRRNFTMRCESNLEGRRESRRVISVALVFLHCLSLPKDAMGGGIFDKYIKRKKLDPLEAYVPAVILTEMQIKDLGKFLEVDRPKYGDYRSLLRSGPAASLRVNIRAVAQYASEGGDNNSAFNDVDECLRALEELDSLLLNASRNESGASIKSMKAKIDEATDALDSLLKTVPSDVLEKGKAIADAYRDPVDDTATETADPELKQLEYINFGLPIPSIHLPFIHLNIQSFSTTGVKWPEGLQTIFRVDIWKCPSSREFEIRQEHRRPILDSLTWRIVRVKI